MLSLNKTHDPQLKSWVISANDPECEFPIQNLPFGVFSPAAGSPRAGVAIGDMVLDLSILEKAGLLPITSATPLFDRPVLNDFLAMGKEAWMAIRAVISNLLAVDMAILRDDPDLRASSLHPMANVTMHLPIFVRSFTDFYASREHATNVGTMFRGADSALMPNWLHLPVGYNGRASSVVLSGNDIVRPSGQLKLPDNDAPVFAPSAKLDFELELGAIVGTGNNIGQPISTQQAQDMIFGYVLLNDWSARDIQVWEYQPLGPFQAKAFATSISPWIVTAAALEPFRVPAPQREKPLLPYLQESQDNNFDINLRVDLATTNDSWVSICETNYRYMYYSAVQQLTHHASCGCPMCPGDVLGSGTISGASPGQEGSLLELTKNGSQPLTLEGGEKRGFLQDGDQVRLSGFCQGDGHRVGFGNCDGRILPAV